MDADPQRTAQPTAFLIAGAGGMLGTALQRVVRERAQAGDPVRYEAPVEIEFDIADDVAADLVMQSFAFRLEPGERGVVLNAAAYTNVERAEQEPDLAYRVNEQGPRILAESARRWKMGLVHVSTDFVFDGTKREPYLETDEPSPVSVYGASKLAGEQAVNAVMPEALTVRTAWVFGEGGAETNFPLKILARAREHGALKVVTDEVGSPTYTVDLARGILGLVRADAGGLYHLTASGSCNRFELAREVLRIVGLDDVTIEPVTSDEFPTVAKRPTYAVLDCSKAAALGVKLHPWQDGLKRYLSGLAASD